MAVMRPPRPSSPPPRPATTPPSSVAPRHEDLTGAHDSSVRFRPARLSAAELPAELTCRFRCDGALVGPLAMLDLSATGFAAAVPAGLALAPGSQLDALELCLGERPVWSGEAVVVHGSAERIGARVTSGFIDVRQVRVGATLERRLTALGEQRDRLPAEWRAAVGDLRQLLEGAREELEELEESVPHDPLRRAEEERALFEGMRARWGAEYYARIAALHALSRSFDERAMALGRTYATAALLPLLYECPMHRRAYDKPLGYSGDYRLMELYFARELSGDSMFGRFLHAVAQGYALSRSVVTREVVMREAVHAALETQGDAPVRVLALAAGPAMELRRLLEETTTLRRPARLILIDQDEAAHETAHEHLTRLLLERHKGALPIDVECLHFSVRQLLEPKTGDEIRVVESALADLDLVYSAGLYDYLPEPIAARLTRLLYTKVRPGGRLLLGNLVEAPDTTWIMEYVLGWHLLYRSEEVLVRLAHGLPSSTRVGVTRDATGHCLFLDIRKA